MEPKEVGLLSLASRWCLETFVEEGESAVNLYFIPDKPALAVGPRAQFLAGFLRRRRRLKIFRVITDSSRHLMASLAFAFVAGSCRHIQELDWKSNVCAHGAGDDNDLDIIASSFAMNSLPCLRTLRLDDVPNMDAFMMAFASGTSPLLENLVLSVLDDDKVLGVLTAIIERSCHEACIPFRHIRLFQYIEDEVIMRAFLGCRMIASVEELIMGGHGRAWTNALVGYLQMGLAQGKPRVVKRIQTIFSSDYPSGDAELLMRVLAKGGAPESDVLEGVFEEELYGLIWSSEAKWLFENKITDKAGACPKLRPRSTPWMSELCPPQDVW